MAEGARLESVYTARYPGFESLSLRHNPQAHIEGGSTGRSRQAMPLFWPYSGLGKATQASHAVQRPGRVYRSMRRFFHAPLCVPKLLPQTPRPADCRTNDALEKRTTLHLRDRDDCHFLPNSSAMRCTFCTMAGPVSQASGQRLSVPCQCGSMLLASRDPSATKVVEQLQWLKDALCGGTSTSFMSDNAYSV